MIYAYIRVSTDKQTVENQRFEINRFAKQRDFQIDVWVEETVSGTRSAKDRKLGVLLKRIKKGDTLIVSEISRLGRRLMEVMSILNACMLKNVILLISAPTKTLYNIPDKADILLHNLVPGFQIPCTCFL